MQDRKERDLPHEKTQQFFFYAENKQLTDAKILTGSTLETSESRFFTPFFTNYKEHLKYKSTNIIRIANIFSLIFHDYQLEVIRLREKTFRNLFSATVSTVRQPVESFFNWLNEKTKNQSEHEVRSTKGLTVHVFGKMAAAFIYLIF